MMYKKPTFNPPFASLTFKFNFSCTIAIPFTTMGVYPHILLVSFPSQGHINPTLQLAKRLLRLGVRVTFATTDSTLHQMNKTTASKNNDGLSFSAFSDGYKGTVKFSDTDNAKHYMHQLSRIGSKSLKELIIVSANQGSPYTHIVYSILVPWVAKVASEVNIPSTLFWTQAATMLEIYNYYFNGYQEIMESKMNEEPSSPVKLPGLPELTARDLPPSFNPSNPMRFTLSCFKEDLQVVLDEGNVIKPDVLVNSVDALEHEAIEACGRYNLIGIGPLIPSAFLDGKDPLDTSSGGDLFENNSKDYIEWLDRKTESSVVYVSFGSISELSKPQMEEIAKGLIDSGYPFLWVVRGNENGAEQNKIASYREALERQGKIVSWCSQVEVLSHVSVGCFVTHCGWNSTLEGLSCGVPMVGFPQWTDQRTNAKMVEDVWKIGVRVNLDGEGMVENGEIKRCLELVMEESKRSKDMKFEVKKCQELATNAIRQDGTSAKNLKSFVDEIVKGCEILFGH